MVSRVGSACAIAASIAISLLPLQHGSFSSSAVTRPQVRERRPLPRSIPLSPVGGAHWRPCVRTARRLPQVKWAATRESALAFCDQFEAEVCFGVQLWPRRWQIRRIGTPASASARMAAPASSRRRDPSYWMRSAAVSNAGSIVAAPTTSRACRIDLRTASRKPRPPSPRGATGWRTGWPRHIRPRDRGRRSGSSRSSSPMSERWPARGRAGALRCGGVRDRRRGCRSVPTSR